MAETLPVPLFQQSEEGYCLPACVRMILTYLGFERNESEISRSLGSRKYGTPSSAIQRLSDPNVEVIYRAWSAVELLSMLDAGIPAIVFVRTGFLDYGQEDYAHALVVVGGVQDQRFWVQDPALPSGPTGISWDGMLAAWSEFDYHAAILRPR
ncbi:MAG: hypothetical protein HC802_10200 [Caldilineaceae bacterium]|nr:hypothetical protein [Caldilineaceae bacterium]